MSSQQQIDANRRNAQLSTGPQTPEGRDAVRFNALRHGLTAKTAVLASENQEHFDEALQAFQAEYQPDGPTQNLLVQQMVMATWRLARLRHIETGLFNLAPLRPCRRTGTEVHPRARQRPPGFRVPR